MGEEESQANPHSSDPSNGGFKRYRRRDLEEEDEKNRLPPEDEE